MTITNLNGVEDPAIEGDALRDIYATIRTIAVIGASANVDKEANIVPAYIAGQGYDVFAVSPKPGVLFGHRVAASLADLAGPTDVVDVFRPPSEAEQVVDAAIAFGASILWFQPDTHTEAAVRRAAAAGITVVSDRCIGATHQELGLGGWCEVALSWGRSRGHRSVW